MQRLCGRGFFDPVLLVNDFPSTSRIAKTDAVLTIRLLKLGFSIGPFTVKLIIHPSGFGKGDAPRRGHFDYDGNQKTCNSEPRHEKKKS